MTNTNKINIVVVALVIIGLAGFFITSPTASPIGQDSEENGLNATSTLTAATSTGGTKVVPGGSNTVKTQPIAVGGSGTLRYEENVSLWLGDKGGAEDLNIFFRDITNDSRCARDVRCIQAGYVTADLVLRANGVEKVVQLQSNGQSTVYGGYRISIIEVIPDKYSDKVIMDNHYMLKFHLVPLY